jgi:type II secretory pathway component PulF
VPRFKLIFTQFDGQLPAFTQKFLNLYNFIEPNIVYATGVLLFLTTLSIAAFTFTQRGHYLFSKIKLHIPLLGNLFVQGFIVLFCKTLATLLAGGVSIIEIFDVLITMTNNDVVKTAIIRTKKYIIEGSNIHLSAAASGFFPSFVIQMIRVGEENGSLPQVLQQTAEHYERKMDTSIKILNSILEPIMIITAGAIVMLVVIALYLPFSMSKVGR